MVAITREDASSTALRQRQTSACGRRSVSGMVREFFGSCLAPFRRRAQGRGGGGGGGGGEGTRTRTMSFRSLLSRQRLLFRAPILVVVAVASLDSADKQLLASSFAVLSDTLGLNVEQLGFFSMASNLSYALSLPAWGWLVHRHGMSGIHLVLAASCMGWGLATILIAVSGSSFIGQVAFRALNGAALGSILPLSQTLLVDMVEPSLQGRAFGLLSVCEKMAGTLSAASVLYFERWQNPYFILGLLSILMAMVAKKHLHPSERAKHSTHAISNVATTAGSVPESETLSVCQILRRIATIPAFACLVAQGVFGGTPWDMMSFLLLLMDWRGFTRQQILSLQFSSGVCATIGGWIGGMLGDYAHAAVPTFGRIAVAIVSVAEGIPLYGLFLHSTHYATAMLWYSLFNLWAVWTPPAALRPICADLAKNPSERAQIVALWIVLEKASGAIFGAPLVGYLTSHMLRSTASENLPKADDKADALAFNLLALSSLFWSICVTFWVAMAIAIAKDANATNRIGSCSSGSVVAASPPHDGGLERIELQPLVDS